MISVIIPFHNEEKNIPVLVKELSVVLQGLKREFEIVLVDDGSNDSSISNLKSQISNLNLKSENLKIIKHRKRFGKGEALKTGIDNSSGTVIIFMDGDLQDDPNDLNKFLKKIDKGYDFVNGVRKERKDSLLIKFYSKTAGFLLKKLLRSPFTDINCGLKAFKRQVVNNFTFYGNNFRFFPLAVYYQGYKVTEVPVNNRPRIHGQTKFGSGKLFVGLFDTLTAYFLYRFSEKPLHFFGTIGGILFLAGFIIDLYLAYERIFFNVLLYRRPLLWLGILMIIIGIQIVMTGIIGELIVYLNKKSDKPSS